MGSVLHHNHAELSRAQRLSGRILSHYCMAIIVFMSVVLLRYPVKVHGRSSVSDSST